MIFSSYEKFKKNLKKNNFSQIYTYQNINNFSIINNLLELVSLNKNSFVFESVEKVKTRGRYTIFGFNSDLTIEINNNQIIETLSNKKKKIKKKNPYNYLNNLKKLLYQF